MLNDPLELSAASASGTLRPSSLPRMFPFWKSFVWNGHDCTLSYTSQLASQHSSKMVFRAEMSWTDDADVVTRPVVVKFTPSYCEKVHVLLAEHDPPYAPALYHCQKVADVGDLYIVVMDYVAEGDGIDGTRISPTAVQQLRKAISHLHGNGYVFGDLRLPNIIQTKDGMMLIDPDWAGRVGEVRYPADISLGVGIAWHDGVERGGLIAMEHDLHLLESL